jgi:hypothetical protein
MVDDMNPMQRQTPFKNKLLTLTNKTVGHYTIRW